MKKILLMFLLFFTIASVPAFARNWVEFANKMYIDIDSIEPYIDGIRVSRKEEYVFWTKTWMTAVSHIKIGKRHTIKKFGMI